jgi:hypothetical protein
MKRVLFSLTLLALASVAVTGTGSCSVSPTIETAASVRETGHTGPMTMSSGAVQRPQPGHWARPAVRTGAPPSGGVFVSAGSSAPLEAWASQPQPTSAAFLPRVEQRIFRASS